MFLKKSADGEIQLEFNEQIYPKEKILEAIKDFKGVCKMTVRDNVVCLRETNKKEDVESIAYEFSNYLLSLVVSATI